MAITIEEVDKKLNDLVNQINMELVKLRISSKTNTTRLESLIRLLSSHSVLNFDDYLAHVQSYINMTKKVLELNDLTTVAEKVRAALTYNNDALVLIYADDLNILPIIKSTGAIPKSLNTLIYSLPHTEAFTQALEDILKEEEVTPVTDATN